MADNSVATTDVRIEKQARQLSRQLKLLSEHLFPPQSQKTLRTFTSGEAAQLIGVSDGYLRQLSLDGKGPIPDVSATGRRSYRLDQIGEIRAYLAAAKPKDALTYLPRRRFGEKLQTIAVTNFKGGSAKTTTAVYLAQYLALQGLRVLAIDLDPQASLSSMLGVQPEFDVVSGDTLYGAIRYDEHRRPLKDIVRQTYFSGLDLVPGNLELMEFEHETPRALMRGSTVAGEAFFERVGMAISEVEASYDVVVIDCPPQLGYLTLGAVCAATALLITIHPQMVDVASMSQFLLMTADLLAVVREAGGALSHDWIKYCVTRHEPFDAPQSQIVALLRNMFADDVLTATVLKSTGISDAGLSKQTLYEIERGQMRKSTYDRALESVNAVNSEVLGRIYAVWGR